MRMRTHTMTNYLIILWISVFQNFWRAGLAYFITMLLRTCTLTVLITRGLSKIFNPSLSLPSNHPITPTDSARKLDFIFDSSLTFSKQISSLSSACNYHIRDLRRIRHTLDLKTASVISTSLVHSKLDYCNSLYLNLPQKQIYRLQLLQNSLARAVTRTPKLNISPRNSNICTGL